MPKRIVIELANQIVTAYEATGSVFHVCDCVTGDSSHPTPSGKFKIERKHHPYTSKKYGVPMNYAMFFTTTGEALHKYHGPAPWWLLRIARTFTDEVGSHGCVRLQEDDAKKLYSWAPTRTQVEVR
jgi:lipoprotein-anchoring transpeptidase ErfK/SrfK